MIDELLVEIRSELQDLKELIGRAIKHDRDRNIIGRLLINLRYLTKHVAFKEEQECRIIRIVPLGEANNRITVEGTVSMYIEYKDIRPYARRIHFAPKATQFKIFRDRLLEEKLQIECSQCDHPFA